MLIETNVLELLCQQLGDSYDKIGPFWTIKLVLVGRFLDPEDNMWSSAVWIEFGLHVSESVFMADLICCIFLN